MPPRERDVTRAKPPRVVIRMDANREWRYSVKASNGKVIASSEEGFKNFGYAKRRALALWPHAIVIVERA